MLARNDQIKVAIGVAVLLVVTILLYLAGIIGERPADGAEAAAANPSLAADPLPAPPAGDDLARAEQTVQEVFGDDLKAADTRKERIALARKMIETAVGSDPADRFVLFRYARDLAIAAGDSDVGVRAVEELVDGFVAENRQDAQQWAREGHRLWNQAADKRPPEKLRGRLEAAECYLRAVEGLAGFQRAAVEKRLKELGWRASSLSLADAREFFGLDRAAWKIDGDCLRGTFGNLNTADGWAMGRVPKPTAAIDFGFKMKAPSDQCIRIEIDGVSWVYIRGSHGNSHSSFWQGREAHWGMSDTPGSRIDPPDAWHRLSVRLGKGKVAFSFDGQPVREMQVAPAGVKPRTVRVGFGRQEAEVRVKDFRLTVGER